MINASGLLKSALYEDALIHEYVKITLEDGTVIIPTDDDIANDNNYYTDGTGVSGFPIGNAICKTIQIDLFNDEDQFKDIYFTNARIDLYGKVDLSDGTTESIYFGKFTVITPESYGTSIQITACDDMYLTDRLYAPTITLPNTAEAVLVDACKLCGLQVDTNFPNKTFQIESIPEDISCREVIGLIACIGGGNARIDRITNAVKIISYTKIIDSVSASIDGGLFMENRDNVDGGAFMTGGASVDGGDFGLDDFHYLYEFRDIPTYDANDIVITGIKVVGQDESYLQGTDEYSIEVVNKLTVGKEQELAELLGSMLIGFRFRKFECSHIEYPLIEFLDICNIYDTVNDVMFTSFITDMTFTFNGDTSIKNSCDSVLRTNSYRVASNTTTKQEYAIQKEFNRIDKAIDDATKLIGESSGVYASQIVQADGSIKYFLHDKAKMEESKVIWAMTSDMVAVSTDGGKTYATSLSADGTAILNRIYARGIDGDYIIAGSMDAGAIGTGKLQIGKDNDVLFTADFDNQTISMSADTIFLGNKQLSTIFEEITQFALTITPEYTSVPVNKDGSYSSFPSIVITPACFYGGVNVTVDCTITIAKTSSGVIANRNSDKTVSIVSLTEDTGWVDITATYVNKYSSTKRFTIAKLYKGADGESASISIKSATIQYVSSTNGTTAPSTGWSTTIPTVNKGSYLWTKTTVTYSDDTKTESYSVAYKGTDGADGKTTYVHFAYSTSSDGSSNFSTVPFAGALYIGTRTDQVQADSKNYADYEWSLFKGEDGKDGEDGKSVSIKGSVATASNLPATSADGDGYITENDGHLHVYSGGKWTDVGQIKGDSGKDGNGIASITYTYKATSTQTAPAASTVTSSSIPTLDKTTNKYLWQKEVIKYSDTSVSDKVTVLLIAVYGDTGAAGTGITSITEHYQVSSSATTAPTTWQSTVPTLTAINKYLWNYETINYTTGASEDTNKRVIGVFGKDGINGNDGLSIGTITNYYLATNVSSGVTISTSGWTETVQSVSSTKKYLWNYEQIKYSNGTVASTSTPCIIGAYGEKGDPSYLYTVDISTPIIKRSERNELTPASITLNTYKTQETSRTSYAGRYRININDDNNYQENIYTSSAAESTKTINIASIIASYERVSKVTITKVTVNLYDSTNTYLLSKQMLSVVNEAPVLTPEKVFDILTDGGAMQGLYKSGNQIYINAEYIKSGIIQGINIIGTRVTGSTMQTFDMTKTINNLHVATVMDNGGIYFVVPSAITEWSDLDKLVTVTNSTIVTGAGVSVTKPSTYPEAPATNTFLDWQEYAAELKSNGFYAWWENWFKSKSITAEYDKYDVIYACYRDNEYLPDCLYDGDRDIDLGAYLTNMKKSLTLKDLGTFNYKDLKSSAVAGFMGSSKRSFSGDIMDSELDIKSDNQINMSAGNAKFTLIGRHYQSGEQILDDTDTAIDMSCKLITATASSQIQVKTPTMSMNSGKTSSPATIRFERGTSQSIDVGLQANNTTRLDVNGGNFYVSGNISCGGTKSRLVKTKHYGDRLLSAYETPTPYFGDIGESQTNENGQVTIMIEEIFGETVNLTDVPYQVFLQKYGPGDVWVESRDATSFTVKGTPNLKFGWEIKAVQLGYESYRIPLEDSGTEDNKEV